jgi:O-antigen/teichoic acid export membrane protein
VIGRVSFPALAAMQADHERMRSFYFTYIRYLSTFIFPVGVGIALTAPVFIPVFLSSTWNSAIAPTSLISMALTISAIGFVPGVLYKAMGRPEILNRLGLIKISIAVAVLWYCTRWGIIGVAAGQIIIGMISVTLDTLVANWIMHYQLWQLIKAILPSFSASIVMGLSLIALNKIFTLNDMGGFLIMVIFGIVVYFATVFIISRSTVTQGLAVLRQVLARPQIAS